MLTERQALIALNMVPDTGSVTARRLAERFGSAAAALTAGAGELAECQGIGKMRAMAFAEAFARVDPVGEEAAAAKIGVRIVAKCDPGYPRTLLDIYDPPLALYCFGDTAAFDSPAVAMVGTRNPSHYGVETARRFAYALATAGYAVVSGMARGIDAAAHRGALDARGRTLGVLGGAIDCFYPDENRELGRAVAKSGGLIISEYPLGRQPDRQTFPMRNRIISGLSAGTLVVEAATKSGSLITASQAAEQGKPVMAVPGRIDTPTSLGCNKLIQEGARMVLSPEDVMDELATLNLGLPEAQPHGLGGAAAPAAGADAVPRRTSFAALSDEERRIVDALGGEERPIDEVIRVSGVGAGRANGLLIGLQLKRLVEILPGGWVRAAK